jgi:hypothetical protein
MGYHKIAYIECEIPEELYIKIDKYIDREIEKYEKKCNCEYCKEKREHDE